MPKNLVFLQVTQKQFALDPFNVWNMNTNFVIKDILTLFSSLYLQYFLRHSTFLYFLPFLYLSMANIQASCATSKYICIKLRHQDLAHFLFIKSITKLEGGSQEFPTFCFLGQFWTTLIRAQPCPNPILCSDLQEKKNFYIFFERMII